MGGQYPWGLEDGFSVCPIIMHGVLCTTTPWSWMKIKRTKSLLVLLSAIVEIIVLRAGIKNHTSDSSYTSSTSMPIFQTGSSSSTVLSTGTTSRLEDRHTGRRRQDYIIVPLRSTNAGAPSLLRLLSSASTTLLLSLPISATPSLKSRRMWSCNSRAVPHPRAHTTTRRVLGR